MLDRSSASRAEKEAGMNQIDDLLGGLLGGKDLFSQLAGVASR